MRRAILAVVLAFVAIAPGAAASASAGDGASDVVRWSGNVVLAEPFLVDEGTTLVVEAGTRVMDAPAAADGGAGAPPAATLVVRGRLVVNGTAGSPVIFRVPVALHGSGADGSLVRHAAFEGAGGSACAFRSVDADYRVEAASFTNHSFAVCVEGGAPVVANSTFRHNGFLGAPYEGDEPPPCDPNESRVAPDGHIIYTACPRWPVFDAGPPGTPFSCWRTWSGGGLCRGVGGAAPAVSVVRGRPTLEANAFHENHGAVHVHGGAGAILRGNAFVDNDHGVLLHASDAAGDAAAPAGERVIVEGNTFLDHGDPDAPRILGPRSAALEVWGSTGGGVVVRDNEFRDNGVAVQLFASEPAVVLRANVLAGNGVGVASDRAFATIEDSTFESLRWDVWMRGPRERIEIQDTALDESGVHVEREARPPTATIVVAVASIAALIITASTEAGRSLGAKLLLVAGFTRLARRDVLRHETRERLLARVAREPGVHLSALARDAGSYGAAVHHLRRLEREGFVKSQRDGRHRRYYVPGAPAPASTELAPLARRLLALARESPGMRVGEMARALDCSRQLASHHARALAERGLIVMEAQEGGRRTIRVADAASRA